MKKLKEVIASYGSVLVAFSGGVDSTLVLKVAREALGRDRVKAATAVTESFTEAEFANSRRLTGLIDVEQTAVKYSELAIPGYAENTARRCYFCKKALYEQLHPLREQLGLNVIANGTNCDDLTDFRPGNTAAHEHDVRSPLVEAGLTKSNVREISKFYGLPTWDAPANACLSSRIPYGEPVTEAKLGQIREGEAFLKSLGFRQVRLRHHNSVARIEVGASEIPQFFNEDIRRRVDAELRRLGFLYVTVDLGGYRVGGRRAGNRD